MNETDKMLEKKPVPNQFLYHSPDDFFNAYRGRYSQYWAYRWGMIPNLPASFDNSNDLYELLAWIQRAFKMLLDDFLNLELEFEEFKNAIIEMLEVLIPQIIREFIHSQEFIDYINQLIQNWYEENLEPIINHILNRLDNIEQEISNLWNEINDIKNEIKTNNVALEKVLINLRDESGVWQQTGNTVLDGNFKPNQNIAGGTINHFGGVIDGSYYIRTSQLPKENDTLAGV